MKKITKLAALEDKTLLLQALHALKPKAMQKVFSQLSNEDRVAVTEPCNGDAHGNPFVDGCMCCLYTTWGRVLKPIHTASNGPAIPGLRTFACRTLWSDNEGNSFARSHDRVAADRQQAMDDEAQHNRGRMTNGMAADGWSWNVIDVEEKKA